MEKIELVKQNGYYTINLPDEKYRGKGIFYTTIVNAPVYNTEPFQNIYQDYTIYFISPKDKFDRWWNNIEPEFKKDPKNKVYHIIFPRLNQPSRDYFCWPDDLNSLQKILLVKAIENFNNDNKDNFNPYTIQVEANQTIELTGKYAEIAHALMSNGKNGIPDEDWENFVNYLKDKTDLPPATKDNMNKMAITRIWSEDWADMITEFY